MDGTEYVHACFQIRSRRLKGWEKVNRCVLELEEREAEGRAGFMNLLAGRVVDVVSV